MSGIEIEEPARDRILRAASRLFYEQGYPNTGINEILSEAGAFKKSLYIHFPSKIELGKAYVQEQEAFILGTIERIIKRHDRYAEFIASWMRVGLVWNQDLIQVRMPACKPEQSDSRRARARIHRKGGAWPLDDALSHRAASHELASSG